MKFSMVLATASRSFTPTCIYFSATLLMLSSELLHSLSHPCHYCYLSIIISHCNLSVQLLMKTALIKMTASPIADPSTPQEGASSQAHSRRMLLLSLRKPAKMNKMGIRELFENDRKPIFSFAGSTRQQPEAETESEGNKVNSTEKAVEFNIRNLISRTVPRVSSDDRQNSPVKGRTQRDFRINREKLVKSIRNVGLEKMRQDFMSISEQLGMIANLKEQYPVEAREALKSRKNRTTYYMNNFMKAKVPRQFKEGDNQEAKIRYFRRQKMQKIEIYPWEKSFETEEDNFMQA